MICEFRVCIHPLGVVVYIEPGKLGELLIPGEEYLGIGVAELERIAHSGGLVRVAQEAAGELRPRLSAA